MSDDDWDAGSGDDWDDDAIEKKLEAQLKEKEKERRREEGLDSESEEEEPKPDEGAPKPKPKPKPTKAKVEKVEEPKLSAEEEKLRRQRLVEEADARLAEDLFSGIEKPKAQVEKEEKEAAQKAAKDAEEREKKAAANKPRIIYNDAFEKVNLVVQADVEKLIESTVKKVDSAPAKGAATRFLSDLLKQLDFKLENKDVDELIKRLSEMALQKKVAASSDAKNNKANNKLSKTTKFNAASEWEEVYGGGAGDEDWTQEEWDEWQKQQDAEWAASAAAK